MKSQLRQILTILPKHCYAFAYGSAVFKQSKTNSSFKQMNFYLKDEMPPDNQINSKDKPIDVKINDVKNYVNNQKSLINIKNSKMIDFIIVVDDSLSWHQENLKMNRSHYSFLKRFGARGITKIQENFGANCYFNTLIPYNDETLIKYGVIKKSHFINDLLDWDHLYVSGRLQKPVQLITFSHTLEDDIKNLETLMKINRQSAIHACLLQLPEEFSEEDLFLTLVGLSYKGDFRMIFGEDRNKIRNIVDAQLPLFNEIYQTYLDNLIENNILQMKDKRFIRDCNPRSVLHSLNLLPKRVQQKLYLEFNKTGKLFDIDDVLIALSHSYEYPTYLQKSLSQIVRKSSIGQSAKGILTAGLIKSTKYSFLKLIKMKDSLRLFRR